MAYRTDMTYPLLLQAIKPTNQL